MSIQPAIKRKTAPDMFARKNGEPIAAPRRIRGARARRQHGRPDSGRRPRGGRCRRAFSVMIEAVAEPLARKITESVAIPAIGIGASVACDGQVLVLEDMLGLSARVPKFVKRYGNLGPMIEAAIEGYATDVRSRAFPGPEHVYGGKPKA